MKLSYVDLCGFRSYRKPKRVTFAPGFTILEGRNGAGKSTLFDAVEFALTGEIKKHKGSSKGETINDYVWWTGTGPTPVSRYVEVGFEDEGGTSFAVRRTDTDVTLRSGDGTEITEPLADPTEVPEPIERALTARLTDASAAPDEALEQLCKIALVRDEYIADFSLELSEPDRYNLVRQALGATDADEWTTKGAQLVDITKKDAAEAEAAVSALRQSREAAQQRFDEANHSRRPDSALQEAAERLRALTGSPATAEDDLVPAVREWMSQTSGRVDALRRLLAEWLTVEAVRAGLGGLDAAVGEAREGRLQAERALEALPPLPATSSSQTSALARELTQLADLGQRIGLRGGACPLCGCDKEQESFERGVAAARESARQLDDAAVERAEREQARATAENEVSVRANTLSEAERQATSARATIEAFDKRKTDLTLAADATASDVEVRLAELDDAQARAATHLRTLKTREYDSVLVREERRLEVINGQVAEAERVAGRTRRAATTAKALHNAAKKAALETLQERFNRVQPLMKDLYLRLNPHPVWKDFDFVIRGKVKGYMRFQVGGEHNPRFVYSSGQRRVTGLAFLLAVNLSLAWSKWKTIMLDDPVQHIDDFRAVQLAEVVGQFVRGGRQVICAVEDAALADLLTRRLPNEYFGAAQRVALQLDPDGSSSVGEPQVIPPLPRHTITQDPRRSLTG